MLATAAQNAPCPIARPFFLLTFPGRHGSQGCCTQLAARYAATTCCSSLSAARMPRPIAIQSSQRVTAGPRGGHGRCKRRRGRWSSRCSTCSSSGRAPSSSRWTRALTQQPASPVKMRPLPMPLSAFLWRWAKALEASGNPARLPVHPSALQAVPTCTDSDECAASTREIYKEAGQSCSNSAKSLCSSGQSLQT